MLLSLSISPTDTITFNEIKSADKQELPSGDENNHGRKMLD
jgi:hypothetical protein